MLRTTIMCALIIAACFPGVSAEESGATSTPTTITAGTVAGYVTTTDVREHAKVDLDIKDIQDAMKAQASGALGTAYTEAQTIYTNGKNSNGGTRTLAGFGIKKDEPFGKLFEDYKSAKNITPHDVIAAALAGADSSYGEFATGSPASDHAFRSQLVKKNLKFQVLLLYALHEIESAVGKYKAAADPASATSQASIQKALDEWWVFYAGSLETGTASGYGTYILAEKRSSFFGTDGEKVGNGGKSRVNKILLAATKQLQTLFKTAGNGPEIDGIVQCMRAQLKVPVIQGCIMYAYKSDTSSAFPGTNSAAARGELMSFCTGALPYLHAVDPAAAEIVRAEVDVKTKKDANPSFTAIKGAFSAANLNKMGLSCADIGGFVDGSSSKTSATTKGSDFAQCQDGSISNTYADSNKCTGTWVNSSAHREKTGSIILSLVISIAAMLRTYAV